MRAPKSNPGSSTPQARPGDAPDWTRRILLGSMATAGLGYALLGPRGRTAAPAGRTIVDYWEKWTGQEGQAMKAIVDDFNERQSSIYVRYFSMSAIDQKAMVAIAGGNPPDLVGLYAENIPIFAEAGALTDMTAMAESAGIGDAYYAAPTRPLTNHEGKRWGFVNTCATLGLYYNRRQFREAGLDPDRPPRTIPELDAAAEKLTITADGSRGGGAGTSSGGGAGGGGSGSGLVRAGFLHRDPGWWDWIWGYHFGGTLVDASATKATAADPRNIAAYQWVQSYPERFGSTRLSNFQSGLGNYNSADQGFLSGRVSMSLHGPFLVNVINAFRPDLEYAAAPFPVTEELYDPAQPMGLVECDVISIPRGAKNPEAAFEFLRFTQRQENVERLAMIHCKPSPLVETSPNFEKDHPNRSIAIHNAIVRSPRGFTPPRVRIWPQYKFEIVQRMATMWDLRRPAAEVMVEVQERGQAALDLAAARRALRQSATT